ncbi:MAG: type I-G CRISPR-associated protein, Cas3-extension family [Gemmatimonadaceae bacterium]
MTRVGLKGLKGSNPLGFMASVGLLRLLDREAGKAARLGFTDDGTFHAWIECDPDLDTADLVARDAAAGVGPQPWRLEYEKLEKKGIKVVADLKPPPEVFSQFLDLAIGEWIAGRPERADHAAAYGTDVACDGKQNTKPTAFHFTAANQQFLGTVEETRRIVTKDWIERSLHLAAQTVPGSNLRWDPDAERSRALMGVNPNDDGTVVNAPLEWLAFRGLPAFPCVPIGDQIVTCAVTGRRQDALQFHWPLWSCGATYATIRSLLVLTAAWTEARNPGRAIASHRARGVFAVCTSEIRRTAQGFGNFGPALVHV